MIERWKMSKPVEVLISIPLPDSLIAEIRNVSPLLRVKVHPTRKVEEIPKDMWRVVEVLYTDGVIPEPDWVPNLRWIQFHWAGVDHAIAEPILRSPRVQATTISGAAASEIAEYIMMMLLSLGHRLPGMLAYQKKGEWAQNGGKTFSPFELRDSVVGIVGYGAIGRQLARVLQPFGTTVLATKMNVLKPEEEGYSLPGWGDPEGILVRRIYPSQALKSMVSQCDFLVVAVPLTENTKGLVSAEVLAALKQTAFLVDVSRGGVVDHQALIPMLVQGQIGGAALDVFPEEPLPASSPLWDLPNVILTPHIAGNTPHYRERAVALFIENLKLYLAGERLLNRVELERGY